MRTRFFSFLAVGMIAVSAVGSASAAETAKPRFSLDAARDGFVRLDTVTGAVTHCSVAQGKWTCDEILSGGAALVARVDQLALDVARLSESAAALDGRVARLAAAGIAAPAASEPATTLAPAPPSHVTVAGTIVTRFLAMVRLLKHGRQVPAAAASRS